MSFIFIFIFIFLFLIYLFNYLILSSEYELYLLIGLSVTRQSM